MIISWVFHLTLKKTNYKQMKIALIGYGKMGQFIEKIAKERGHEIVAVIDIHNLEDFGSEAFRSADVAIEFTRPEVAVENIKKAFESNVPVVCGTTGWTARLEEIMALIEEKNQTLFWASNFSLGVNIFFAINKNLAQLMNQFPAYDAAMTEIHHIHKLDAPSGTAITLAENIIAELDRKEKWTLGKAVQPDEIGINDIREGETPGTHIVTYDSEVDSITIQHEAKNRQGFALGAVIAAEFTAGKKGFLGMNDLLKF